MVALIHFAHIHAFNILHVHCDSTIFFFLNQVSYCCLHSFDLQAKRKMTAQRQPTYIDTHIHECSN